MIALARSKYLFSLVLSMFGAFLKKERVVFEALPKGKYGTKNISHIRRSVFSFPFHPQQKTN